MNITPEPAHSSLAQRIAKIRHCMLVEVSTGVSATNKDLFVSLCQTYEQQNIVPSYLPSELRGDLPTSSIFDFTQGTTRPPRPVSMLSRNIPSWQRWMDFLVANQADGDPGEETFADWDKSY